LRLLVAFSPHPHALAAVSSIAPSSDLRTRQRTHAHIEGTLARTSWPPHWWAGSLGCTQPSVEVSFMAFICHLRVAGAVPCAMQYRSTATGSGAYVC
jgi:hypothetical protein